MNLIQSWKESLRLFERQNLKSFLMVTVKAFVDVYGVINRPLTSWGNWAALGVIICLVLLTNFIKMLHLVGFAGIVLNVIFHFLFFIFCLAMRPSTDIKDLNYFRSYLKRYWIFLAGMIVLGFVRVHFVSVPLIFIWYVFSVLFAFDSRSAAGDSLRALQNGFRMVIYNLPICAVLWLIFKIINDFILSYCIAFTLEYFGGLTMAAILYIFFVPIEVALITNLYIKFVHSQSSLYFPQPKQ